jgi:DNA-binding MarR family transcriptional regulator
VPEELVENADLSTAEYQSLGAFRQQIRRFLHFSQEAARAEGLEPQQHQLLLAIRASADDGGPTIGALADSLMVRHHSAVGLIDRLADHELVERTRGDGDRRQVRIRLTPRGNQILRRLSHVHREELRHTGALLVEALGGLLKP